MSIDFTFKMGKHRNFPLSQSLNLSLMFLFLEYADSDVSNSEDESSCEREENHKNGK